MRVFASLAMCCAVSPALWAQWTVQASGTAADLHAVHAVSEQIGWASGSGGTVLRTVNGGAAWEACPVPAEARALDFRGVQGFDGSTAVVMSTGKGELSRVYRTTDGCKTWELVFTNPNPDGALLAMQFQWKSLPAPQKGYFARGVLVGRPVAGEFVIYTSKDHGGTWQDMHDDEAFSPGPSARAHEGELVFPESNTALTASADGDSFAFVTGGGTGARLLYPEGEHARFDYVSAKWTFSELALPMPIGPSSGAYSVAARRVSADRVDLMVVGGDATNPGAGSAVFVRHGGPILNVKKLIAGRAAAAVQPPSGYRSAVAYYPAADSWITVGPNGTDVSRDDGHSWTRLSPGATEAPDADKNWQAMSLPFVVGAHGRIGRMASFSGTAAPAASKVEVASGNE